MFALARPELKPNRGKNAFGRKESRGLLLGLDGSGKTTLLYKLKLGELVTTIPTIGFNVESLEFGREEITLWDVGGQEKLRPLWRHYLQNTNALLFAVDAADPSRFTEARDELLKIVSNSELDGVRVIVIANKQDLPTAVPADRLQALFHLDEAAAFSQRETLFVNCCMTDYSEVSMALCGSIKGPIRSPPEADSEADPRPLVSHMLWRVLGASTGMLGGDLELSVPATRFGAARSLPAEVIAKVVAFLPLTDLLPEGFLSKKYAMVYPQTAWLTSQAFLVASFSEAVLRISSNGSRLVDHTPTDAEFDVRPRLRPLMYLQLPQRFLPLQCLTVAALFVVQRYAREPYGLAEALRTHTDVLKKFVTSSSPAEAMAFAMSNQARPVAFATWSHPMAFALALSQVLNTSVATLSSGSAEWRLDGADEFNSDLDAFDDEPHGEGIDLVLDVESTFLEPLTSLVGDLKSSSKSAEFLLGIVTPLIGEVAKGIAAYVSLPRTLLALAPTHAAGATMPVLRTFSVSAFPSLFPIPKELADVIRTGLFRVLTLSEKPGSSDSSALPMGIVEAALDVIRGVEASRCRYVKLALRPEVLPLVLLAVIEGIEKSSSVREVKFVCDDVDMQQVLTGESTDDIQRKCHSIITSRELLCDAASRGYLRIRMRA